MPLTQVDAVSKTVETWLDDILNDTRPPKRRWLPPSDNGHRSGTGWLSATSRVRRLLRPRRRSGVERAERRPPPDPLQPDPGEGVVPPPVHSPDVGQHHR